MTDSDVGIDDVVRAMSDVVVLVDGTGTVRGCNSGVRDLLGISAADIIGGSVLQLVHPDHLALAVRRMAQYVGGDEVYQPRIELLHADGSAVPVEIAGRRLGGPDGGHLIFQIRRLVGGSAEHVLADFGIGLVVVGSDGSVVESNPVASELLGHAGVELSGPAAELLAGGRVDGLPIPAGAHPFTAHLAPGGLDASDAVVVELGAADGRVLELRRRPFTFRSGGAGLALFLADVTDRHRVEADLRRRATLDDLTGLCNRSTFMDRSEQLLGAAVAAGWTAGMVFGDVDRFKQINERFGHGEADRVLQRIADGLRGLEREALGELQMVLGRLGGDEFAALVTCPDPTTLDRLLVAIHGAVRRSGMAQLHESVTASLGLAVAEPGSTPASLVEEADVAMRTAKRLGRDRVHRYDAAMRALGAEQRRLELVLRDALEAGRIGIAFQPVVQAPTGTVAGAEALARLEDRDGTLLPASVWFDVAVRSGLAAEVDGLVLDAAIGFLAGLPPEVRGTTGVGVNLATTSLTRPDLDAWILDLLAATGFPPDKLVVEIPETALPVMREVSRPALARLRQTGVHLAVDDFGAAYASLAEVRDLTIDIIKIDRSFVVAPPGTPDAAVLAAAVQMSQGLGCVTVAEGVETAAQYDALVALGVEQLQGHLLGEPMPPADYAALLASGRTLTPDQPARRPAPGTRPAG